LSQDGARLYLDELAFDRENFCITTDEGTSYSDSEGSHLKDDRHTTPSLFKVDVNRDWITLNGHSILCLPQEFRSREAYGFDDIFVLQYLDLGRPVFLKFDQSILSGLIANDPGHFDNS